MGMLPQQFLLQNEGEHTALPTTPRSGVCGCFTVMQKVLLCPRTCTHIALEGTCQFTPQGRLSVSLLLHVATCLRSFLFFFFFPIPSAQPIPLSWLSIFSKFYPGEPNPITRALKSRVLSLAGVRIDVAEEEVREIRRMRGTLPPLLEGATWKARGGLWVASRSKDGRQPGRKRTSVLLPRGTESDQKLE